MKLGLPMQSKSQTQRQYDRKHNSFGIPVIILSLGVRIFWRVLSGWKKKGVIALVTGNKRLFNPSFKKRKEKKEHIALNQTLSNKIQTNIFLLRSELYFMYVC